MKQLTFTTRQRQIVALVAKGKTYAEIGEILGISRSGAKTTADVVRNKLRVEKRRQIPDAFARQTGENPYTIDVPELVAA